MSLGDLYKLDDLNHNTADCSSGDLYKRNHFADELYRMPCFCPERRGALRNVSMRRD